MIDRQKLETVLGRRFPGVRSLETNAAALNAPADCWLDSWSDRFGVDVGGSCLRIFTH